MKPPLIDLRDEATTEGVVSNTPLVQRDIARLEACFRELLREVAALPPETRAALRANAGAWASLPKEHARRFRRTDLPGWDLGLPEEVREQCLRAWELWRAVPEEHQRYICWLATPTAETALSFFNDVLNGESP